MDHKMDKATKIDAKKPSTSFYNGFVTSTLFTTIIFLLWHSCMVVREFGDYYTKAIDETWYKSAVLQHKVDNESFVYAVPHDDKDDVKEEGDIKVMASHAIFRMDAGKEAPGCVVGFQFEQQAMYKRFKEITSQSCEGCLRCDNGSYSCYVIDNNGYIILSSECDDTGRFFGEVQGNAMKALVEMEIFKAITVYDFQAVCKVQQTDKASSFATILITPFQLLRASLNWILMELVLSLAKVRLWVWAEGHSDSDFIESFNLDTTAVPATSSSGTDADIKKTGFSLEPCDKKATLYMMNHTKLDNPAYNASFGELYFSRIKLSNLLLVVAPVNDDPGEPLGAEAKRIYYTYSGNNTFPCHKRALNNLPHRRLDDCFTENCREYEMNTCSRSSRIHGTNQYILMTLFVFLFYYL